jgi:hypothetical protein
MAPAQPEGDMSSAGTLEPQEAQPELELESGVSRGPPPKSWAQREARPKLAKQATKGP